MKEDYVSKELHAYLLKLGFVKDVFYEKRSGAYGGVLYRQDKELTITFEVIYRHNYQIDRSACYCELRADDYCRVSASNLRMAGMNTFKQLAMEIKERMAAEDNEREDELKNLQEDIRSERMQDELIKERLNIATPIPNPVVVSNERNIEV